MSQVASKISSSALMNPKLKERRSAVLKNKKNRRLQIVLFVSGLLTLILVSIAVLNSSLFDVDEVIIVGAVNSDQDEVNEAIDIEIGDKLLDVDESKVEARLSSLPWVRSASVVSSYGGKVEVTITERVAMAALPTDSGFVLIDTEGIQLEQFDEISEDFVVLEGIKASGQIGAPAPIESKNLVNLINVMDPSLRPQLQSFSVDSGIMTAEIRTGGAIRFGSVSGAEDLAAMNTDLLTVLEKVDLSCVEVIDLGVPGAPIITRSEACDAENDDAEAVADSVLEANEEP